MTDNDQKVLFDHRIRSIRSYADDLRQRAQTLAWLNNYCSDMDRYDLRMSEQALRDAADAVAITREKLAKNPKRVILLQAAE